MISKKVRLLWIDDSNREKDAKDLNALNNNIIAEWIHPVEFETALNEKKAINDIDLFLIDYGLSTKISGEKYYQGEALSLIGRLRENYPDIPVYLYSSDKNSDLFNKLEYAAKKEADRVISIETIQDKGSEILYSDAIDFQDIRDKMGTNIDDIIKVLLPPEDEIETIKFVLPDVLRMDSLGTAKPLSKSGESLAFAKWIRDVFLENPGFVYDDLHTATLIGMDKTAFSLREKEFQDSCYSGVFAKTIGKKLWWKNLVIKNIFKRTNPEDTQTDVRIIAQEKFSLKPEEIAKCAVCKELLPDVVGYNPASGNFDAVHLRCSKSDPIFKRRMYFDEQRIVDLEETQ